MLTEILSGLWIGSIHDAYNEDYYKDNLIDIVINCTVDQGFLDIPNLKKIRIPITSELSPNRDMFLFRNNIDSILKFIQVRCFRDAGGQRTPWKNDGTRTPWGKRSNQSVCLVCDLRTATSDPAAARFSVRPSVRASVR